MIMIILAIFLILYIIIKFISNQYIEKFDINEIINQIDNSKIKYIIEQKSNICSHKHIHKGKNRGYLNWDKIYK